MKHTLTRAECKNKLWGIITAPTIPTACFKASLSQPVHDGTNNPWRTDGCEGAAVMYYK